MQVLDRWHQHTSSCLTCQAALRTLSRTRVVAAVFAAVLTVVTLARVATSAQPLFGLATALGVGLAVFAAWAVLAMQHIR